MRNALLAAIAAFLFCAQAEAQCARVVAVNVGGFAFSPQVATLSTIPFAAQSFAMPVQSFAFQQQFVNPFAVQAFAAPVAVQQVRIRRGLFGRVRRIDTVSSFGAVGIGGFRGVRGFRGRCF